MIRKISVIVIMLCSLLVVLSACSGNTEKSAEAPEKAPSEVPVKAINAEPVTLKVLPTVAMTDEEFDMYFVKPTKIKYPNITIELVRLTKGQNVADLIQSGVVPDIFYAAQSFNDLYDLDIPMDLREFIKKNNFQLNRLDPTLVDDDRGANGEIYGLPITQNASLVWYNKSIFDKFGVPYPKDRLTWEDSVDLTRRLTRVDGSVQYYGFHPYQGSITELGNIFQIALFDPSTDKPIVSPQWKEVFTTGMNIFNVPGNKPETLLTGAQARNKFMKDQTLAMIFQKYSDMFAQFKTLQENNVNFDFIAEPRYAAMKDYRNPNAYQDLVISQTTKHPDQAFAVVANALSDEVQTTAARSGKIPTLISSAVQKQFGADNELLKSKNIQALFLTGKVPPKRALTRYDVIVKNAIRDAFAKVYTGEEDINTALREAEEAAIKNVAAEKAK